MFLLIISLAHIFNCLAAGSSLSKRAFQEDLASRITEGVFGYHPNTHTQFLHNSALPQGEHRPATELFQFYPSPSSQASQSNEIKYHDFLSVDFRRETQDHASSSNTEKSTFLGGGRGVEGDRKLHDDRGLELSLGPPSAESTTRQFLQSWSGGSDRREPRLGNPKPTQTLYPFFPVEPVGAYHLEPAQNLPKDKNRAPASFVPPKDQIISCSLSDVAPCWITTSASPQAAVPRTVRVPLPRSSGQLQSAFLSCPSMISGIPRLFSGTSISELILILCCVLPLIPSDSLTDPASPAPQPATSLELRRS